MLQSTGSPRVQHNLATEQHVGVLFSQPGIEATLQGRLLTTGPSESPCFYSDHPNRCEGLSHCGYDLDLPDN